MVQALHDAAQVTVPVVIGVAPGSHVQLMEDRALPPRLALRRCGQPFTAPAVRPDTTLRRKINTRIAIGTTATTLAAKSVP